MIVKFVMMGILMERQNEIQLVLDKSTVGTVVVDHLQLLQHVLNYVMMDILLPLNNEKMAT